MKCWFQRYTTLATTRPHGELVCRVVPSQQPSKTACSIYGSSGSWGVGSWLLGFSLAVGIQFSASIKNLDWDKTMTFWGTCRECWVAALFGDLLFIKCSGHCHHYFQEGGLEISLIALAASSDSISSNLSSFQIRKSLEMCYALRCVARAGLDLARKTRPKQQKKNPLGERWQRILFTGNLDCARTLQRGT